MPPPPDPLDNLLDELRAAPPAPSALRREIWQRLDATTGRHESTGWLGGLAAVFARPSFAIVFVAACLLLGLFLVERRTARIEAGRSHQLAQNYLALIDPLLATNRAGATPNPNLAGQLEWMRRELHLTPAQYERIKTLHESSGPHLLLLARELSRLHDELAAFEAERQTAGQIDFVEFARFVETRRNVDRECLDSTRTLIASTARVMDEEQRRLYLAWLGPLGREDFVPSLN